MPIYVFRCNICGYEQEELKAYIGSSESKCEFCGGVSNRAHDKETINMRPDIEPYYNPSLGEFVTSRKDIREKAAYFNAAVPDLMMDSYPADGRLTKEERVELENRKTVLDSRRDPGWGRNPIGDDGIAVEGEANYDSIKSVIKKRHGWRDK